MPIYPSDNPHSRSYQVFPLRDHVLPFLRSHCPIHTDFCPYHAIYPPHHRQFWRFKKKGEAILRRQPRFRTSHPIFSFLFSDTSPCLSDSSLGLSAVTPHCGLAAFLSFSFCASSLLFSRFSPMRTFIVAQFLPSRPVCGGPLGGGSDLRQCIRVPLGSGLPPEILSQLSFG